MYHPTKAGSHDILGSGDTAGSKNTTIKITTGLLTLQSLESVKPSWLLSYSWALF